MGKKILWASNTYWNSPFQVGANHLAREFIQQGWEILFLSDPVSPIHLLKRGSKDDVLDCFSDWLHGVQSDLGGKLKYYSPFTPLWIPVNYPFLRTRFVLDTWHRLTIPRLLTTISKNGFDDVDILVVDTIANSFLINEISAKKTVFRITDNFAGFTRATELLLEREKHIAQSVDLVVYTAKNLEQLVINMEPKRKVFVPNGVNVRHFLKESMYPVPDEYTEIQKPIVLYVGAMNFWFDWELVNYTTSVLQEFSFVFIGPEKLAEKMIIRRPNVHILGRRAYSDLPSYIHHADIGIIPFNVKQHPELVNSINPIKLYEYLACGIPVVSVKWKELENLRSPAYLTTTHSEFVDAILKVDNQKSTINKESLKRFAEENDWSNRAGIFMEELSAF